MPLVSIAKYLVVESFTSVPTIANPSAEKLDARSYEGLITISPFSFTYPYLLSSLETIEKPFAKSLAVTIELSRFATTSHFPLMIEIPFPFRTVRATSFSLNAVAQRKLSPFIGLVTLSTEK